MKKRQFTDREKLLIFLVGAVIVLIGIVASNNNAPSHDDCKHLYGSDRTACEQLHTVVDSGR